MTPSYKLLLRLQGLSFILFSRRHHRSPSQPPSPLSSCNCSSILQPFPPSSPPAPHSIKTAAHLTMPPSRTAIRRAFTASRAIVGRLLPTLDTPSDASSTVIVDAWRSEFTLPTPLQRLCMVQRVWRSVVLPTSSYSRSGRVEFLCRLHRQLT